jgi:hypothetical protein
MDLSTYRAVLPLCGRIHVSKCETAIHVERVATAFICITSWYRPTRPVLFTSWAEATDTSQGGLTCAFTTMPATGRVSGATTYTTVCPCIWATLISSSIMNGSGQQAVPVMGTIFQHSWRYSSKIQIQRRYLIIADVRIIMTLWTDRRTSDGSEDHRVQRQRCNRRRSDNKLLGTAAAMNWRPQRCT